MKPVWHNAIEEAAFRETRCRLCFQPDEALKRITNQGPGCAHLARAADGKMPKAWSKRRNPVLGDTYKCDDFIDKPPVNRRKTAPADTTPMLDAEPDDYRLVPVDGWPDYRAEQRKQREGDHQ